MENIIYELHHPHRLHWMC